MSRPMPRNSEGRVEGWQPWPRWRVTRTGHECWVVLAPGIGGAHPDDRALRTYRAAIAYASQKAREQ